jgi:hypothetical protein
LIARGKIPYGEEKANTISAPVPGQFPASQAIKFGRVCVRRCPVYTHETRYAENQFQERLRRSARRRVAAAIDINELAIFRDLVTIAQFVRRKTHANEGKSAKGNAVGDEGPRL